MRPSPSVRVKGPPACVTACVHLSLLGLRPPLPLFGPHVWSFLMVLLLSPRLSSSNTVLLKLNMLQSCLEDWLSPSPWVPSPESLPHGVRAGCRAHLLSSSRSGRCRHLPHCPPPSPSPSGEAENHLGELKSEKELNTFRFCLIYFVYLITK